MKEKAKQFLGEIVVLEKKYGLSLAHEDTCGRFIVEAYSEDNVEWLLGADIGGCNGT